MTYSCTDFTDDLLNALEVKVPPRAYDDPAAQAKLALDKVAALKLQAKTATKDFWQKATPTDAPVNVWVVQGEHWSAPGRGISICASPEVAARQAAKLVNIMLSDRGLQPLKSDGQWMKGLRRVQSSLADEHEQFDGHCDVWITKVEINT